MKAGGRPFTKLLLSALLLCCGLLLSTASSQAEDSHTPLEPIKCPGTRAEGENAVCFLLHVPADWRDISNRTMELPVMRFAPLGDKASKPPLLVLAGGPGQSVIELEKKITENLKVFRQDRELILMDQRGTGPLAADVRCSEAILKDEQISVEVVVGCVKEAENNGKLLSDYSTDFAVQDYRALRYALQIETWAVLSNSYGARVAQGLIKTDNKGIDRVLFNGPLFVGTRFFDWNPFALVEEAIELCNEQEACRTHYPDLYWSFQRLPFDMHKVKLPDEEFPADVRTLLYRKRLQSLLARHKVTLLPADITKTARSLEKAIEEGTVWVPPSPLPQSLKDIGLLTHFANVCAEDIKPMAEKPLAEFDQPLLMAFYRNACETIDETTKNTVRLKRGWKKADRTKKPVLILNGQYDTIVNPDAAAETLKLYPNGAWFKIDYAGHDLVSQIPCAREITDHFLGGMPAKQLKNACETDKMPNFKALDK